MTIMNLLLIALMIEAMVNALKPLWDKGAGKMTAAEIVAMCFGIVIAVACRINLLEGVVVLEGPAWVGYIFYVMTGIAIGRGPSFLHDLWKTMQAFIEGREAVNTLINGNKQEELLENEE